MRMSGNHGLPRTRLLVTLCVALAACKDEAPPQKVDPDQPLVQRPRRPDPRKDSPFRHPDTDPPAGRDGDQIPEAELEAALASAKTAAADGDTVRAAQALLACANKTPASARCDGELGVLLADVVRRKAEATYYLVEASGTDDPKANAELYARVADALRVRGQLENAAQAAELALAREDNAERHTALGRILQSIPEQLPRAAEEMGKAFALDPENLELLYEQATVLGQINDAEAASQAAGLFAQWLGKASPPDERKEATRLRIAELRANAERIARENTAAKKNSG